MKLFRSRKTLIWLTAAVSLLAVFVATVSTLAWFQISSPSELKTSLVTGSSDMDIQKVTGYKIEEKLNANGQIDYGNETVVNFDTENNVLGNRTNLSKEDADTHFDVPSDGIGYYLIWANADGAFKFTDSPKNYVKFTELNSNNASAMYVSRVQLGSTTPIRIRHYTMSNNETVLNTITPANTNGDSAGKVTCIVNTEQKTIAPSGASAYYKVWFDSNSNKVGFDDPEAAPNPVIKGPQNLHGTDRVYACLSNVSSWWFNDGAKFWCRVMNSAKSSTSDIEMTSTGTTNYYYVDVDTSTYVYIIFVRGKVVGTDWWNQTDDLTIPTDIHGGNTCCWISDENESNGHKKASWGTDSNSSRSYNFEISPNNGTTWYTMSTSGISSEYSSVFEYKATFSSCSANGQVKLKLNGENVSISRKAASGGNYNDQCFKFNNLKSNSTQIREGGTNVDVYLDVVNNSTFQIWVDPVYKFQVGTGTKYQAIKMVSGDTGYTSNTRQYKATIPANQVVASSQLKFYVNDENKTSDYTRDSDTYNNINNSKNIVTGGIEVDAYFKLGGNDASPVWTDGNGTVWVSGNKTYKIQVGSGSNVAMEYCSTGSFSGWYHLEVSSIIGTTDSGTASVIKITLNGNNLGSNNTDAATVYSSNIDANKYTSARNNAASITDSYKLAVKRGGTVDIYVKSGDNYVYVKPKFDIKVGSTLQVASEDESTDSLFKSNFAAANVKGGYDIKIYQNGADVTSTYSAEGNRSGPTYNNISSSKKIIFDVSSATDVEFRLNSCASNGNTMWCGGHNPTYAYKIGSGSYVTAGWTKSGTTMYVTIPSGTTGQAITVRKNGSDTTSVTLDSDSGNNLDAGFVIHSSFTSKKLIVDFVNDTAYLEGRQITYYFYVAKPLTPTAGCAPYCYLWQDGTSNKNASFPGVAMTQVSGNLYSYSFYADDDYDRMIFSYGDGSNNNSNQSVDINLGSSEVADGKYCHFANTKTNSKWDCEWYASAPITGNGDYVYYVNDKGNTNFGGDLCAHVRDSSGVIMQFNGHAWPGTNMDIIIPGSLWKIVVPNEYDKIKFNNGSSTKESAELDNTGSDSGKVWVTSGNSGTSVSGSFVGDKVVNNGTAKIYRSANNGTSWTEIATMQDGDNVSSNKFIYEHGVQAYNNDLLKVVVSKAGQSDVTYADYNKSSGTFVNDATRRPYFVGDGASPTASTIKVNIGQDASGNNKTARFNFYVTTNNKLSIVMVPDLGNGFYIMKDGASNDTRQGFIGEIKMNTASPTSAVYHGYYATTDASNNFFIRSYLNAKDEIYTLATDDSDTNSCAGVVEGSDNHAIYFKKSGFFDIEVYGGKIYIKEYSSSGFFKLNRLNTNSIGDQPSIKAQKTSLVIEVSFKTSSNDFLMGCDLKVNNSLAGTGVNFYAPSDTDRSTTYSSSFTGRKLNDPYGFMRDNKYQLTNTASTTISGGNFRTAKASPNEVYYVYIIIDYYYVANDSTLANYAISPSGNIQFTLMSHQAAAV